MLGDARRQVRATPVSGPCQHRKEGLGRLEEAEDFLSSNVCGIATNAWEMAEPAY